MDNLNNPYVTTGEPKLKESIVAFVDILGYKSLVKETGASEMILKILHCALTEAREYVDPKNGVFHDPQKKDAFAFRAFTDNIVIGYPMLHWLRKKEPGEIFKILSRFQLHLAVKGFFVRGGISIGKLYMDDIVVFGPALTEAYEAEQKLARDPRIVLAKTASDVINKQKGYSAKSNHNKYLREDVDGQYFVHYLDAVVSSREYFNNGLELHKASIEKKLKEHIGNPVIWNKYRWLADYHNYYCNSCPKISDTMKVSLENFIKPIGMIAIK